MPGSDHVAERVNPMCSHITGSWLVGIPDVIPHGHAVQMIIAGGKPGWTNYPPRSVRDDFLYTNAVVLESPRELIFVRRKHRDRRSIIRIMAAAPALVLAW